MEGAHVLHKFLGRLGGMISSLRSMVSDEPQLRAVVREKCEHFKIARGTTIEERGERTKAGSRTRRIAAIALNKKTARSGAASLLRCSFWG